MAALAKHAVIFQTLHQAINRGTYRTGDRLPSETALGRRFKASRPTVAQALRNLAQLGLVDRHAGAGTFVRHRTPALAGTLGLLADGLHATEIAEPVSVELSRAAQAAGWQVLMGDALAGRDPGAIADEWAALGVKGVFLAPLEHHPVRAAVNHALAERLGQRGLAVVLLDRDLGDFPERSRHDLVAMDDFFAGLDLAAHILDRARRRLAFVARPEFPATTDLRLAGVRAAVARVDEARVEFCVGLSNDPAWVKKMLTRTRADAVICSNDATAAELIQALHHLRLAIPGDVMVAGFDDVRYARLLSPALTTMRQPCAALGATAVETMLSRLRLPHAPARRILLRAELIARASTGRPRK